MAFPMKIVLFTAGLGNQIFQYFFSLYLKDKYPSEKIYGCYDKAILNNHNGLEIHEVFDIQLPPSSFFTHALVRVIRALYKRTHWTWLGAHDDWQKETLYYEGYWHNKALFGQYASSLRFRVHDISEHNATVLREIQDSNSVAIHIRRGDYLDPIRSKDFAQSCSLSYYHSAIEYAQSQFQDAKFYIFSDDIPWVIENLSISNAVYVDWNKGKQSFWDMYLMSNCKASIIANSSFSFWGAMLGINKQFVIKPKRWIGNEVPDIFPESWISLS